MQQFDTWEALFDVVFNISVCAWPVDKSLGHELAIDDAWLLLMLEGISESSWYDNQGAFKQYAVFYGKLIVHVPVLVHSSEHMSVTRHALWFSL